jgi:HAD superfamily hydrolase (TIGR01509 family)
MSDKPARDTKADLRAVLVDIDGTLLDSNDAHARAWMNVLKRRSNEFPFERVRPLIGKGGDKLLAELLGDAVDREEIERLGEERSRVFLATELHGLKPTRGARELLERIKAADLQVVVATSAAASETAALLKQAGLDDLIDQAADSSDASQSKPDPDIVESALRKAGLRAAQAVMLGDTPYDVESAARAGVSAIVLRCGGWWNDDAFKGAVAVHDDPADLLASFEQSLLDRARQP